MRISGLPIADKMFILQGRLESERKGTNDQSNLKNRSSGLL